MRTARHARSAPNELGSLPALVRQVLKMVAWRAPAKRSAFGVALEQGQGGRPQEVVLGKGGRRLTLCARL